MIQTSNLTKSNFIAKVNMTLLQTAEIADQNGRRNVGKTNCGNDELVFLARAIKEGRRSRRRWLQMWLGLNNRRQVLKLLLLLYYCWSYSQRNITVPRSSHSCRWFLQESFILSFSLKTWLAVRHRTACFPTRYTRFKHGRPPREVVYALQASIIFVLLKKEELRSSRSSCRLKQVVCAWQK